MVRDTKKGVIKEKKEREIEIRKVKKVIKELKKNKIVGENKT